MSSMIDFHRKCTVCLPLKVLSYMYMCVCVCLYVCTSLSLSPHLSLGAYMSTSMGISVSPYTRIDKIYTAGVPTKDYKLPTEWVSPGTVIINVSHFKNVDEDKLLQVIVRARSHTKAHAHALSLTLSLSLTHHTRARIHTHRLTCMRERTRSL